MELHPKIQEVAVLSGTAMRFVLDRLTVAEGWSELPPVPALPSAHIEYLGNYPLTTRKQQSRIRVWDTQLHD